MRPSGPAAPLRPDRRFLLPAVAAVGVLFLPPGPAAAVPAAQEITGTWESEVGTKGGVGLTLRAAPKGELFITIGAMAEGRWTFEQGHLRLVDAAGAVQEGEARIDGNRLVQKGTQGEARLKRIGTADPTAPLVGCWKAEPSPAGGPAPLVEYAKGGVFRIRLPLKTERGKWRVAAGRLSLSGPSVPARTSPLRLEGEELVLAAEGKLPESRYRRVPSGACRLPYLEAPAGPPPARKQAAPGR